jgi:hypothetical protein
LFTVSAVARVLLLLLLLTVSAVAPALLFTVSAARRALLFTVSVAAASPLLFTVLAVGRAFSFTFQLLRVRFCLLSNCRCTYAFYTVSAVARVLLLLLSVSAVARIIMVARTLLFATSAVARAFSFTFQLLRVRFYLLYHLLYQLLRVRFCISCCACAFVYCISCCACVFVYFPTVARALLFVVSFTVSAVARTFLYQLLRVRFCLHFFCIFQFTFVILLVAGIIVSSYAYIDSSVSPIQCMIDKGTGIKIEIINNYCWIMSTFTLPRHFKGNLGEDFIHYGVGK